ncbi:MAG: hypothetical protein ACXQTG_04060, partial [Methanoculleaceae archaeon]
MRNTTCWLFIIIAMAVLMPSAIFSQSNYIYFIADTGGGPPGNDLLTLLDLSTSTETSIGTGTGTFTIEGMATYPGGSFSTQTMYGSTASRLYLINKTTGVGTALSSDYGTGTGPLGSITFSDIDGVDFDESTDPPIMYGSVRNGASDLLVQINYATGAHVASAWGSGTDYIVIAAQGPTLDDIDDIAIRSDGVMYGINNNSGREDRLVIIDKTDGSTTDVGRLRRSDDSEDVEDMEGLSFDCDDTLWGSTGQSASTSSQRNRVWMFQTDASGDPTRFVTEIDHMTEGGDYESLEACVQIDATPTPSPSPLVPTPTPPPSPTPSATPELSDLCLRTSHGTLSIGATSATSFVNSGLEVTVWAPETSAIAVFSSYDCDTGSSTESQNGSWDLRMDNTWSSQTISRYLSGQNDLGMAGAVHIFENAVPGNHTIRLRHKSDGVTNPQIATRSADMVGFALTLEDGSASFNYGIDSLDAAGDTTSSTTLENVDGLSTTVTLDIPGRIFVSCALNGSSAGGSGGRTGYWDLQVDGQTVGVNNVSRHLSGSNDIGAMLLQGLSEQLCQGTYTITVRHRTSGSSLPLRTSNATL